MLTLEDINEYSRNIAILLDEYIHQEKQLRDLPYREYLAKRQPFLDAYRKKDNELHDDIMAKFNS
jgi:hypothetical protein